MNLAAIQQSPAQFRKALHIDYDAGPTPFTPDPWQDRDFKALDAGWSRAAGIKGNRIKVKGQSCSRAWLERPRGHSKSLDLAIMACYALFASRRRLSGIAAAGDRDQAKLLRDACARLVHSNAWLSQFIEVHNLEVVNKTTGSSLEVISSDAKTSYGLTPDFVICDELVHWSNRGLWDSLLSSAAKRKHCMLVVISNAGLNDDWCWQTREAVRTDPNWYFSRLDGPVASWISPELLQEQERLLPSIAYRRLWLNEWTSGGGDALSEDVINAAFIPDLTPQTGPDQDYHYVAGMDLGVSRDASAICVLGIRSGEHSHGRIRLAATRIWKPTKGNKVDLANVERELVRLHHVFGFQQIRFDPWQSLHMASRLASINFVKHVSRSSEPTYAALPMFEVPSTGNNLQKMATVLIEAFNDGRIELYPEPNLKRDLFRLRVEERSYGFRLTSPRDEQGHGDMASAFQLALLAAQDIAQNPPASFGKFLGAAKWDDLQNNAGAPSRLELIMKDLHANGWSERSMNQAAAFLSSTNTFS